MFIPNIIDSQMPHDLVDVDWKAYLIVKRNLNAMQAWTAKEILEFLEIYKLQTVDDKDSPTC